MAKQAALAFVKRTLDRCQQFEMTGNSCFSELLFREMFLSRLSQFSDAQQLAASTDGESGKLYCIDGRVSGSASNPLTKCTSFITPINSCMCCQKQKSSCVNFNILSM